VLSVERHDTESRCAVEVRPPMADPFISVLRTHRPIVEDAMTYVLYDADDPVRCDLDEHRLRAAGMRDGRAYFAVGWEKAKSV
jgi:hypothetical protein